MRSIAYNIRCRTRIPCLQALVSELKTKLCALFDLKEKETQLWDYYKGDYYEKLDTQAKLGLTLDVAKLLPNQQVMLEEKVRYVFASLRTPSRRTSGAAC